MKKVIGLYGKGTCGKTSTLNKLIDIFSAKYGNPKYKERYGENDIRVTFRFEDKVICISTGGDSGSILEANCKYFEKHNFNIAISATRTSGDSCSTLINFNKEQTIDEVDWHKKCIEGFGKENYQDIINTIEANELFEYIGELCKL